MSSELKMPFGKFKGTSIRDLPGDYLRWLGTIKLHGPLRAAVQAALSWKAVGSTPENGKPRLGAATLSPAVSKGVQGTFPGQEAARPKRPFIPRQEDLSQYYTPQGADDIPW
jgi:hypothetical protein